MRDFIEGFRAAMRRVGLEYADEIIDDGKLHRVRAEGDKGRDTWYVLHAGPPFAVGVFGSWRGVVEKTTWHGAAVWPGVHRGALRDFAAVLVDMDRHQP